MTEQLTQEICKMLDDKKGLDIVIVDIEHLTIVADKFIICSGHSTTQVKGLANNVEKVMDEKFEMHPLRIDGKSEGRWVVLDYGYVIVHIFDEQTRNLYSLEKLWSDGVNVRSYDSK